MSILEHTIMQIGELRLDVDPERDEIKATLRHGEKGEVSTRFKKMDLFALTFAIMGPREQDQMIPVRQTEMVTYRRIHTIKVKKPLKPGDTIKCKCEINVPQTIVEGLKGMVEQQKKTKTGVPIIGGGGKQIVMP